jgi:serine protease AprX
MVRGRYGRVVLATGVALVVAFVAAGASWGRPTKASESVVVRVRAGQLSSVEREAQRLGGTITLRLPIVNGFAARVPVAALPVLRGATGVLSVSLDVRVRALASTYSQSGDPYSMASITTAIGARKYWGAGYTGSGVGVALIDSGVVPVDGLTVAGKVVNGLDVSFDSQSPNLLYLDGYGHGTHMAGIIAGAANATAGLSPADLAADTTDFVGVAPGAGILNVKVGDAHGATDVSQVIAAIGWVVQHRNDPGLNIRVLNLSYGTDSGQSYLLDPLAYAAEQAWKKGIFVVAAAGNAGFANIKTSSIGDPAYDPTIFAVGATDTKGTTTLGDDTVASFSSTGNAARRVDIVAPGTHIVSLRDPGSAIDQAYNSTGAVSDTLFRGSGTSQAAAVASGAAALIIQQRPSITPGQLKALICKTAAKLKGMLLEQQGCGEVNLTAALTAATPADPLPPVPSTGTGSLDLSRGSSDVTKDGVTLTGEQDIFGMPFVSPAMALLEAAGSSWSGGVWNGSSWSGSSWSASSWSGSSWSASSWSASSWSGSSWSASSWSASSWSGSSWSASSWSASSWSDAAWAASSWSDNAWADATWG